VLGSLAAEQFRNCPTRFGIDTTITMLNVVYDFYIIVDKKKYLTDMRAARR